MRNIKHLHKGCPMSDVGRSHWVWNELIHCKHFILMCLKSHTSQWCFCPRTFVETTGLNSLLWNSLASYLHTQLRYSLGVSQVLWLVVLGLRSLGPWIDHLLPVCRFIFGKSIPNHLVCKFDRNSFRYHTNIQWQHFLIDMCILPPKYFSLFYFYFLLSNSF